MSLRVDQLPVATVVTNADLIPVEQGGILKQATTTQIASGVTASTVWGNITGVLSNQTDLQTVLSSFSNPTWGTFIGTLSNQTDLQNALNAKGIWGGITGTLSNQLDLQSLLNGKANDIAVVHVAGAETITGTKTFAAGPIVPNASFPLQSLNFNSTAITEAPTLNLTLGTIYRSTASGTLTTIAFSGSPSALLPPTVLRLTVTNGPVTLTIPASFRLGVVGSITSLTLQNGNHELSWVYDTQFWLADSVTPAQQTGDIATGLTNLALFTGSPTLADSKISFTDITTGNVSTTAHGFTPKLPNDATKFLNGVGSWVVTGGGSVFVPTGTGFWHATAGVEDAASIAATGTGNVVLAASPTISGVTLTQAANTSGASVVYGTRNTDTAPVGHSLLIQNAAATVSLLDFDINGTLLIGSIPDARVTFTDITTGNVSTSAHGFTPKLPNNAAVYLDGTGAYSVPAGGGGGGGASNVQIFTSSGTWTKPSGPPNSLSVICIGPGGGGGSGMRNVSGTISGGGGGGAGGAFTRRTLPASVVASTITVTVGTGGAGGAAVSVDSTVGNVGGAGSGASSFGTWAQALGGNGGLGGTATGASATAPTLGEINGGQGAGSSATGGNGTNSSTFITYAAAGGSSGGGVTTAPAASTGANGNSSGYYIRTSLLSGGAGGGSAGAGGSAGTSATANDPQGGPGGGGGAGNTAGTGGIGGAGGSYGGGGGGGGASLNGNNSGAGGNGANGFVMVIAW